jgi:hypothetical protein
MPGNHSKERIEHSKHYEILNPELLNFSGPDTLTAQFTCCRVLNSYGMNSVALMFSVANRGTSVSI